MRKFLQFKTTALLLAFVAFFATSCSNDVPDPEAAALTKLKLTAYNLYRTADKPALAESLNVLTEMMETLLATPPEDIVGLQATKKTFPPYALATGVSRDADSDAVDFYAQLLQDTKTLIYFKGFIDIVKDEETGDLSYGTTHYEARLQDKVSIVGKTDDPIRLLQLGSKIFEAYENGEDTDAILEEIKSLTEFSLFV